jgi:hypothetical protein
MVSSPIIALPSLNDELLKCIVEVPGFNDDVPTFIAELLRLIDEPQKLNLILIIPSITGGHAQARPILEKSLSCAFRRLGFSVPSAYGFSGNARLTARREVSGRECFWPLF